MILLVHYTVLATLFGCEKETPNTINSFTDQDMIIENLEEPISPNLIYINTEDGLSIPVSHQKGNLYQNGDVIFNVKPKDKIDAKYYAYKANKWPNKTVYYLWHRKFPESYKETVRNAMEEISKNTKIKFQYRKSEENYVHFVKGSNCSATMGMIGGRQNISLGERCNSNRIALHEILHTLGIHHEHQRPDRNEFIKIKWSNIKTERKDGRYLKHKTWKNVNFVSTKKYDYSSIMHYLSKSDSKNGKNTIVKKSNQKPFDKSDHLTKLDIKGLNKLYK